MLRLGSALRSSEAFAPSRGGRGPTGDHPSGEGLTAGRHGVAADNVRDSVREAGNGLRGGGAAADEELVLIMLSGLVRGGRLLLRLRERDGLHRPP